MKLFGRNKHPKPVIPPELEPYYADRYGAGRRRTWLTVAIIVLVCLGIAVFLWLATHNWQFSSGSDNSSQGKPATSKQESPAVQPPQDNKVLKQDNSKPAKTPLSDKTTKKP